jgi:hypothetical protein
VKEIAEGFELFRSIKIDASYIAPFFGVTVAKLAYKADLHMAGNHMAIFAVKFGVKRICHCVLYASLTIQN